MADSKQDNTPYVDALLEYSARETGRFQVPGHKGGLAADPAMVELVGMTGLINDVPSVTEGVDIGPEPTPFQQAQLLAAEAWGAKRTWFLIPIGLVAIAEPILLLHASRAPTSFAAVVLAIQAVGAVVVWGLALRPDKTPPPQEPEPEPELPAGEPITA